MTDDRAIANRTVLTISRTRTGLGDPEAIRVLLYHRLLANPGDEDWANIGVSQEVFGHQMEYLDRWGYTAITFDDVRMYFDGELNLPKKPVIITFDDAYREVHSMAFPVMLKFGMRGVVFVVGDLSIRTNMWDRHRGAQYQLMSSEQLLEMHAAGFEVGSHTLTHQMLLDIPKNEAWNEISRSRMALEIMVNAPIRSFAYPYGETNDELKTMVHDAGYTIGCAAFSGPPVFHHDLYEVRRIKPVNSRSAVIFWMQLRRPYLYYRWIVWKMRQAIEHLRRNTTAKE